LAVLLSSTACSQLPVEFVHDGTTYVGVPVSTWEDVVARRLDINEVSRGRAQAIGLLRSEVRAVEAEAQTYRDDFNDCMDRAQVIAQERDDARIELAASDRKVKARTPWARAMQIQLGLLAIGGLTYLYVARP
jgi:hypothetical protein